MKCDSWLQPGNGSTADASTKYITLTSTLSFLLHKDAEQHEKGKRERDDDVIYVTK